MAAGLFVYTLISTPVEYVTEEKSAQEQEESEFSERMLTAKHQYRDGTHGVAGMAQVPTPCHRLIAEPFLLDAIETATTTQEESKVEIRFSTLLEGDACPNEAHEVPFYVSFDAPENTHISATWNGGRIRLNLIPVGPDEELSSEVYIKG